MKHYKETPILIVLNIVLEYLLMLATYLVCGFLRCHVLLSFGKAFYYKDIYTFFPFVMGIYGFALVIYGLKGDYSTIHYGSLKKEALWVTEVQVACSAVGASFLYLFQGTQFSRLLLIMIMIANSISVTLKRMLFSKLGDLVFAKQFQAVPILVLGNSVHAETFIKKILSDKRKHYVYDGYLAETKNPNMAGYLGPYEDMDRIISDHKIGQVVIAEEQLSKEQLEKILAICATLDIECFMIPIFSDYMQWGQMLHYENNVMMIPLKMSKTDNILGVKISVTDMDKTMQSITSHLEQWRGKYICVSNVHTTVMAHDDANYRNIQNDSVMSLPDGGPLSAHSRSHGNVEAKRVTGPDLMRECLKKSKETGWRHFFYGSSHKTLDMLKEKIEERYPGAVIAGMISPPFRDLTHEEEIQYTNEINAAKPDFVWVGLGAPKQEIWMAAHKDKIHALMIGVGAAFDYESGNLKRAPKWMQKCNLEWLYRLMQEPKRLFKRYFVTNLKFLWLTRR